MSDREKVIREYENFVNSYISLVTSDDYEFEMHKAVLALLKEQEPKQIETEYACTDCLCRVCARNECSDNYNPECDQDCLGCNACTGTIDLLEDCPREEFVPDEEGR